MSVGIDNDSDVETSKDKYDAEFESSVIGDDVDQAHLNSSTASDYLPCNTASDYLPCNTAD